MTQAQPQTVSEPVMLSGVLLDLARAESYAEIAALLRRGLRQMVGAEDCILVSTAEEHSAGSGCGNGTVRPIEPEGRLGRAAGAGHVRDFAAGAAALEELVLPPETQAARLLPCTGPGSTLALCVLWRAAAPEGEGLLPVAAAAGIAVGRLDAMAREHRGRAELQSRIRNVVATIRSVSTRSADRAESLEDYAMHFEGRLDAMARPHLAFARSGTSRLDLEDLLRGELLAEGIQEGPAVALKGMPIALSRGVAEVLGLALHELAVNCVKFGPLSGRGGGLSVRWWTETRPHRARHVLQWRETCDLPAPRGPYRIGFGRHILERALPYETGAETDLAIAPCSLSCSIAVPDGALSGQ